MERGAGSYLARTLSGNGVERHHLRVSSFSLLSLYSALGLPPAICSSFSRYRLPLYGHCFSATVLSIRFLLSSFFLLPVLCQDTAYLVTVTVFTIPLYVQLFTNTNPFYAKEKHLPFYRYCFHDTIVRSTCCRFPFLCQGTCLFTVTVFTVPFYCQVFSCCPFFAKIPLTVSPILFSRYHGTVNFLPLPFVCQGKHLWLYRRCFIDSIARSTLYV